MLRSDSDTSDPAPVELVDSAEGSRELLPQSCAVPDLLELVRVDVQRDRGSRVPELSRDGVDVGTGPDQVRGEAVPEIVSGQPRLSVRAGR